MPSSSRLLPAVYWRLTSRSQRCGLDSGLIVARPALRPAPSDYRPFQTPLSPVTLLCLNRCSDNTIRPACYSLLLLMCTRLWISSGSTPFFSLVCCEGNAAGRASAAARGTQIHGAARGMSVRSGGTYAILWQHGNTGIQAASSTRSEGGGFPATRHPRRVSAWITLSLVMVLLKPDRNFMPDAVKGAG